MSKSVVTAAAKAKAVELGRNKHLAQQAEGHARQADDHKPADEKVAAGDQKHAEGVVVDNEVVQSQDASMAELALAGGFSFEAALADASGGVTSLVSEAEAADGEGFALFGGEGDSSGGFLLVGALALVALGGYVLFKGEGNKNDAPVITSGATGTIAENVPIATAIYTTVATDADGDTLTYSLTGADAALLNISTAGVVSLKASANFEVKSSYSFNVVASDGSESATKAVTVAVTNVNENPTGTTPLTLTTNEDTPATLAAGITDPDAGTTLTYTAAGATKGTVTVAANGTITYTPNANANGADTFTVTASDGVAGSTPFTTTVNVTITPVDDAFTGPTAPIAITTLEDTAFTGNSGISDPDGPAVAFTKTNGAKGAVVVNNDGTFVYTPNANANGTDTFTITGTQGDVTKTSTINVTITPVNDAPDFGATSQTFDVAQGDTLLGTLTATDPDSATLTYGVQTQPTHGTLTVGTNGALSYTPAASYLGADSFIVTVNDGSGGTDTLTVNVNVLADLTTEQSIDVPSAGAAVSFNAGTGAFVYTDDVDDRTDVIINNFSDDDIIQLTGLSDIDDYSFTSSGGDIIITYNSGGDFTQIVLTDADINADGGSPFVFDYASAAGAVGFDFISIA